MDAATADRLLVEVIGQARALSIPVSGHISPTVVINRRALKRLGCCYHRPEGHVIELSARMLEAGERAVMQTLAHEILHTCPGCANHGPKWKQWAAKMNAAYGYAIARTDSPERLGLPPEEPARYLLVCVKCGAEIGRSRRSALVEHPERYRCRCGGKLERRR